MVVVDNARSRIGRNLDIVVTSVLQTTAGRMIFGRHAEPAGRRRRQRHGEPGGRERSSATTPAGARDPPHRRDAAAIPLVADGLLPDPGHRRSTRSSCGIVSLVVGLFDRRGRLRASVRAVVGAADSLDQRRAARRCAARRCRRPDELRLRRAITRASTTSPILFTALPHQLRIMAKATLGYVPFIGWHLRAQRPPARRIARTRAPAIFKRMQRMIARRRVADRLSRRHRAAATAGSSRSRAASSCWRSRTGCRRAGHRRRQPRRDAERPADGLPGDGAGDRARRRSRPRA